MCRQYSLANILGKSKKDQESLKRNLDLCLQQSLAEHQALQALQTRHNALGKSHTEQVADTQKVTSQAFYHSLAVVPDKQLTLDSGL